MIDLITKLNIFFHLKLKQTTQKVITDSVNYTMPNSSSFRAIKINKNYFNMKIKNKEK